MNIANKIEYYSSDEKRQNIPWIRVTDQNGKVTESTPPKTIHRSRKKSPRLKSVAWTALTATTVRRTFMFRLILSIDRAMALNVIDPSLPYIKQQGVQVLTADYKTSDEAQKAIPEKINAFYQEKYPQIASSRRMRSTLRLRSCNGSSEPLFSRRCTSTGRRTPTTSGTSIPRVASAATMATTSALTAKPSARTAMPAIRWRRRKKARRSWRLFPISNSSIRWISAT